uniref:Putative LOC101240231 [Hydra vulgaris] n=1 Tax=Lepeophtheirus salmonis TaxID=72036 RepID=A0A0K2UHS7_LEPSM
MTRMSTVGLCQANKIKSVSQRVYEQKGVILYNLKELYAQFYTKHPHISIAFSKFCSLCILVGSSGSHSVCVCVCVPSKHEFVSLCCKDIAECL